jgi:hypothetical protein
MNGGQYHRGATPDAAMALAIAGFSSTRSPTSENVTGTPSFASNASKGPAFAGTGPSSHTKATRLAGSARAAASPRLRQAIMMVARGFTAG